MPTISELVTTQVSRAIKTSMESGDLPKVSIPEILIERPQKKEHGDFACTISLKLSSILKMNPMDIAKAIVSNLDSNEMISVKNITSPGFINLSLNSIWLAAQVKSIRESPEKFTRLDIGKNKTVQVEYVSANPTGQLHVAHIRGAVIGSTIANILQATGHAVHQEYYINDAGNQIEKFNQSLLIRYKQLFDDNIDFPDGLYPGEDIVSIAQKIKSSKGEQYLNLNESESKSEIGFLGRTLILSQIASELDLLGIKFDEWFSEKTLLDNNEFQYCLQALEESGYVTQKDGATWLKTSQLGEEKDNVLIRNNGIPTYYATDIAYHFNKFKKRNFDKVIDIWGADHHGQIPRLKKALSLIKVDASKLDVILVQMVRFKKGSVTEKLSKRKGTAIPLATLVKEIGSDACRYMFLSKSHDSQVEFDLDLTKKQSSENPIYYIQYAHARICSILKSANIKKIDYFNNTEKPIYHNQTELELIKKLIEFPEILELSSSNLSPHHIPHYSFELASRFHLFYQHCKVINEDPQNMNETISRLLLIDATRIMLDTCLRMMGMTSPEEM